MSSEPSASTADQSYTAATPDAAVYVRVAIGGHVLGVQLEPEAMTRPGHEIAERIVACADVAYLQSQLAVRAQWERANVDPACYADMPTERDLEAARSRLGGL